MKEQGIMVCMTTESTVIIPGWGALASQVLCCKEAVTPCPILVVLFYVVSFYYLKLRDMFYSTFRGWWKTLLFPHSSFTSIVFWGAVNFPFYSSLLFDSSYLHPNHVLPSLFCVGAGFMPLFFIIAKSIFNLKWLIVSLLHGWFWQEIVNIKTVLALLLLRSAAKVLE